MRYLWVVVAVVAFSGCSSWRRDCANEPGCKTSGLCMPTYGTCVAGKDEHCKAAEVCTVESKCQAVGGVCVKPSPKDGAADGVKDGVKKDGLKKDSKPDGAKNDRVTERNAADGNVGKVADAQR